ncbi:MAG TPA: hypothetical protein VII13_13640 [Vicinamibacteria bacterium]|jgi:hypothetical protein
MRSLRLAAVALAVSAGAATARAAECPGPAECCADKPVDEIPKPAEVAMGVVLVGLYNVSEKSGTWDADYYLYEAWEPQEGFVPQTEITNEVARLSEQFGGLDLRDGRCIRARRFRSTLATPLNLRMFPFDRQTLTLGVSESWLFASMLRYGDQPFLQGVDDSVYGQLSQWEVGHDMRYTRKSRVFKWEQGVWGDAVPIYEYATFSIPIRRHTTFHLTKFFLPLFIIVLVAMTVFWVDPEDLASQVGIGVTCLLAAIAFQLAQASTLPEVAYLTLADLVFALSYLAIALALVESLYSNGQARRGRRERAVRIDQICRFAFPLGLLVLTAASVVASMRMTGG